MEHETLVQLSERDFCMACIVSDKVCQSIINYIDFAYFEVDYAKIVMRWVVDYYKEFLQAPKDNILSIYRLHCEEITDYNLQETTLVFLQKIVEGIDGDINDDYYLSQCIDFIEYRKMSLLVENLQACLSVRDMKEGRKYLDKYEKVDVSHSTSIRVLATEDAEKINAGLEHVDDELFTLPEIVNKVVGTIHREDFIAFLAGPKAGKTWCLIWIAVQAMLKGQKVLFISLEMKETEVLKRVWDMMLGVNSQVIEDGMKFVTSTFVEVGERYNIQQTQLEVKKSQSISVEEGQKKYRLLSRGGNIQIETYQMNQTSIDDIKVDTRRIARNGYVPDVIIIDYADILKHTQGGSELRNQLDATWKTLRAFAQEMKAAIFTASQTNRAGLSGHIGAENIAEDMRKLANVTSMVAIESTPQMKKLKLRSMKNIMSRNGAVDEPCLFATAFEIGQFMYGRAVWKKDVDFSNDED